MSAARSPPERDRLPARGRRRDLGTIRLKGVDRALGAVASPARAGAGALSSRISGTVCARDRLRDGRPPPFPLEDLCLLYDEARNGRLWGMEAHYAPLRTVLDPVRHALLAHPTLERVAVTGRLIGDNEFWMQVPGSGGPMPAGVLIAGLMAPVALREWLLVTGGAPGQLRGRLAAAWGLGIERLRDDLFGLAKHPTHDRQRPFASVDPPMVRRRVRACPGHAT